MKEKKNKNSTIIKWLIFGKMIYILSEILFKIQDFKQRKDNFDNIRDNYNSNKIWNALDKEIKRGFERLNNRRLMKNRKNFEIIATNEILEKNIKKF